MSEPRYGQEVEVIFDDDGVFEVAFEADDHIDVEFETSLLEREYTGSYEVTPSSETQYLGTANRILTQNVKINPIPSNYGLITWDGSTLTVS